MPEYRYEGVTSDGRREKGRISALHRDAATAALRERGLIPTSLKQIEQSQPSTAPGFGSVSVQRLAEFTRKFATLSKTDIPIMETFEILGDEEEGFLLPEACRHVAKEIAAGTSLSQAMASRPRAFSPLYVKMVEAGMRSGTLDIIADNMAKMYEAETALRKDITSKMVYPGILMVLCFCLAFILRFIPRFFDADITFISDDLFNFLMGFWIIIVGLVLFGITRPGYRIYREIGMRMPVIGSLMKNINLGRFCRIFGLQYSAGVPILEGLDVSKQVLQDERLSTAISGIQRRILGGMDLRDAMVATGMFPKRMVSMIGAGERAGGVDKMLEKLAEYYELDVRTASKIMTTVLYFIVFLSVAVTVAVVVINSYMGYWNMMGDIMEGM